MRGVLVCVRVGYRHIDKFILAMFPLPPVSVSSQLVINVFGSSTRSTIAAVYPTLKSVLCGGAGAASNTLSHIFVGPIRCDCVLPRDSELKKDAALALVTAVSQMRMLAIVPVFVSQMPTRLSRAIRLDRVAVIPFSVTVLLKLVSQHALPSHNPLAHWVLLLHALPSLPSLHCLFSAGPAHCRPVRHSAFLVHAPPLSCTHELLSHRALVQSLLLTHTLPRLLLLHCLAPVGPRHCRPSLH